MIPKKWLYAALVCFALAPAAYADCTKPTNRPANFPDGSKADLDTMLASKQQVQDYIKSAQGYVDCMDKSENDAVKAMEAKGMEKDDIMAALRERRKSRNDVVDQMQATGKAFNAEIHKYQKQHK